MKLFKKIAPIAAGAVFGLAMIGGAIAAADLGTWKNNFPASNTVIVAYDTDAVAITEIANYLGLKGGTTVAGESYLFERSTTKLTLGTNDLYDIRSTIKKDHLPTTLADGTYFDENNNEFSYTQKINLKDDALVLSHFADKDYQNKAPTLGFKVDRGTTVLDYVLEFKGNGPKCNETESTTITMLGKEYYISKSKNCNPITLLDVGTKGVVKEGETITLAGKSVKLAGVFDAGGGNYKVSLIVDGRETPGLKEGQTYHLGGNVYVGVKEIRYNPKETGVSSAEISIGSGKIELESGENVKLNGEDVEGLTVSINTDGTTLSGLTFTWTMDEKGFVTPDSEIVMPMFGVKFMTTGMEFPAGEEIEIDPSGDNYFKLIVPIKDGTATIPILFDADGDGTFDGTGESNGDLLILATDGDKVIYIDESAANNYFVVSRASGEEAESYYIEPVIKKVGGNDVITLKNVLTSKILCKEIPTGETCEFGEIAIKVEDVNNTAQTATLNLTSAGSTFNAIYSTLGAAIVLPYDLNVSAHPTTYNLNITEEDKDGNVGAGKTMTFTLGFNSRNETSVTGISGDWSGGAMLEKARNEYIGYVASDLASKIEWDKTGNQYKVTITYYGEPVVSKTYIAGVGTTTGTGAVAITADDLTSTIKNTKNIISIGGSGVNPFSAELLGLTFPTYGSNSAWVDATGVDGTGKALVKLYEGTTACPKVCLLVAGFDATDTQKAAKFLTTTPTQLSGKTSALLDTTGESASVIVS